MDNRENKTGAQVRESNPWFYATKPTRGTLFLRTFLPWQAWRFVCINWKMVGMIRKSHGGSQHT